MNDSWFDYNYVHYNANWTEVKDTIWVFYGDAESGTLIMFDKNDEIVKVIGYEKITKVDE